MITLCLRLGFITVKQEPLDEEDDAPLAEIAAAAASASAEEPREHRSAPKGQLDIRQMLQRPARTESGSEEEEEKTEEEKLLALEKQRKREEEQQQQEQKEQLEAAQLASYEAHACEKKEREARD